MKAGGPLKRVAILTTRQAIKRTPIARLRSGGVLPRFPDRSRQTKSLQIPTDIRQGVYERDHGVCFACEDPAVQIQHRMPRQAGGSRDPSINLPSNFIAVCLDCHAWMESSRTAAEDYGYLVRRGVLLPAEVRVFQHGRRWVYLTDSFEVLPAYAEGIHP